MTPTPSTAYGHRPDTKQTTAYYVKERNLETRVSGPFFHEETAQNSLEVHQTDPERYVIEESVAEFEVDVDKGETNDVYTQTSMLATDEGTLEVDLYLDESDRLRDDPVDTLTLKYKLNGKKVRFWAPSEDCECCDTRPETVVQTDCRTQNPFFHDVRKFAQYVVNGTAPRQYNGGDQA